MIDFESQSVRTLLTLAERDPEIDTAACTLAFAQLHSADRFRRDLRHALALHQLTDLQFAALVLLLAVEPEAMPMAVLARKAGVSRSAITDAFDGLIRSGLASRDYPGGHARCEIRFGAITGALLFETAALLWGAAFLVPEHRCSEF